MNLKEEIHRQAKERLSLMLR